MKRLSIMVLVLCLSISSMAFSESLFPRLSTPAPEIEEKAPSYGAMAAVDPDDIQPYDNGGQIVIYNNVDEQSYLNFGNYLSKLGFEVISSNIEEQKVEMMLSDGLFNIGMIYDGNERKMRLIYEQGVEFARKDPFIGYSRITLGDEIEIRGIGRIKFDNFRTNVSAYDKSNSGLMYYYYNTSTSFQKPYLESTLVYINKDNTYEYSARENWSAFAFPLEGFDGYVGFQIPTSLQESRDGTLAIKIGIYMKEDYVGVEKEATELAAKEGKTIDEIFKEYGYDERAKILGEYVLILRENGRKVGDWN